MSPLLVAAENQWLSQLASMRQAITEVKAGFPTGIEPYGHDILVDGEDLDGESNSDDIWDIEGNEDGTDDYSSENLNDLDIPGTDSNGFSQSYNKQWLKAICAKYASQRSGLDELDLYDQIVSLLASDNKGVFLSH